jgi:hypothetical protein
MHLYGYLPKDPQTASPQNQEYETWITIKHFWGPSGPLVSGGHPLMVVPGSPAALVKKLKQTHIDRHRIAIIQHLRVIAAAP